MTNVTPEKAAEITAAVDEAKAKYPWLSQVIAGCLVGWDVEIPPIVYQSLMVKVAEAITLHQFDGLVQQVSSNLSEQSDGCQHQTYLKNPGPHGYWACRFCGERIDGTPT